MNCQERAQSTERWLRKSEAEFTVPAHLADCKNKGLTCAFEIFCCHTRAPVPIFCKTRPVSLHSAHHHRCYRWWHSVFCYFETSLGLCIQFSAVTQGHLYISSAKHVRYLYTVHTTIGDIDGGILRFAILKRLWAYASNFVPRNPSARCAFFADSCHGSAMACKASTDYSVKLWVFLSRIRQKQLRLCLFIKFYSQGNLWRYFTLRQRESYI